MIFTRAIGVFGVTLLLGWTLSAQPRIDSLLNFDWKFIQQEQANAHLRSYDDQKWETVQLPHDASIYGAFLQDGYNSDRKNGFRPRLKGWYRKKLAISNLSSDSRYFLDFEGIYRDARVFFNEKEVAHQLNGYEGFEVEITDLIQQGDNLIAVSYDNTDMESSRWYNGEGIYRDVWLKERSSTYFVKDGLYITTPKVDNSKTEVAIQIEVLNDLDDTRELTLLSEVYDEDGIQVGETVSKVPVSSGELYVFNQSIGIENPRLWNVGNAYLYTVKNKLSWEDQLLDELETPFGIRTIQFDPNRGLLVNGEKVFVKGVNIHHDLGPLGAAAFERGYERRLEGLEKLGCNAIRLSHNPHDTYILDWCDRNGMLVFDEAFDKWEDQFFGEGNAFEDHWRKSLEAFIRRDRNHPCVFIWSVGNETHQQRDPKANFGIDQMKVMADFVHQLEPGRKVTCGLHPSRKSGAYRTENYYREGPPEMEFYMDVVSTNYREEFWPMDHENYPQLTFILSEAQVGNLGNEWFNFNHDYGVGMFYWGGTDYIGESFGWPAKGWPNGVIDWNDHWKPFTYYIQSLYSEEPMVRIAAYDPSEETAQYWNEVNLRFQPMFSHWNWKGKDSVRVMTFSNTQEVELLINGKSMGLMEVPEAYYTKDIKAYTAEEYDPENPINTGPEMHTKLEWVVPYSEGEIVAIARNNGVEVARHKLQTAGEPERVILKADRERIQSDGLDLSYIDVEVVDKNGVIVPSADHEITFKVTGAGINAGVSNADVISDEPFQADNRKVFQGRALLVVRSTKDDGKIKIRAETNGLKGDTIKIITFREKSNELVSKRDR
ncbi:glycoside hydrolase family 2 TIM barrel-domain containing protein [Marinoscillum sp. MHG1-6]|uniref:glycoside hydrolase family 2 TIM barrel-domain containing protein n=1 Tax=Marinoscillum sp. MHG1-6 TaxID=2959627 RepID=UPI002157C742|nr:glycoside hydrolase family 2 TIM barrel-domain containing protein [Marinoscillum sp. MHG1-6]